MTASACCRAGSQSASNFCSTSQASSRTIFPTSRISPRSASRPRCAGSIRCSTASGSTISISTSRSIVSVFRRRPATRCAAISRRRRRRSEGSQNRAGIADPAVDALVDRIIAAKTREESDHRLPRARPRDPRRALLDSALVPAGAPHRLLGRVRASVRPATLFPRHSGYLVVRSRQGGQAGTKGLGGRHGRACPGHPRLYVAHMSEDVDARDKRGHDENGNQ